MNKAVIQVNTADVSGAVRQQAKTSKPQNPADNSGFRNMLSSAINADGASGSGGIKTQETTPKPENPKNSVGGASATETVKSKPDAETQESGTDENIEKPVIDPSIVAAMQAIVTPEPLQVEAGEEVQSVPAEIRAVEASQVQAPQAETSQAQVPQADASQVQEPQSETKLVQAPQAEASQVQSPQPETKPVQAPQAEASQAQPQAETRQVQAPQSGARAPEMQQQPVMVAETASADETVETQQTEPNRHYIVSATANREISSENIPQTTQPADEKTLQPVTDSANASSTGSGANIETKANKQTEPTVPDIRQAGAELAEATPPQATVSPKAENTERPDYRQPLTVEIVGDRGETQVEARPAETGTVVQSVQETQAPADKAQTRFDEMLARASQELGQSKAVQPERRPESIEETPEELSVADDTVDAVSAEVSEEPEAKIPLDTPERQSRPLTRHIASTARDIPDIIARETAPRAVRQPRETIKAEDSALGMTHTKNPESLVHETVAQQPSEPVANPVKVPEQAEQIRMQVLKNLEEDKMEFNMRLHPEELGKVDVKMILESGKLAVEIIAANPKATELLTKQAEGLLASLRLGSIDVSSVNIVTASQTASGYMEGQFNLNNFQNQAGAQGQRDNGRGANSSGGSGGTSGENEPQQEGDSPASRLGRLNYSV